MRRADGLAGLVRRALNDYAMPTGRIYVALSGGADSVSLLLCLCESGAFDVSAIHINHGIRGAESDRDEAFCVKLCERLGAEIICRRVDAVGFSRENGMTLEEGARELRYRAFAEIAGNIPVATAHTMSDSIETMLINMLRGSGLKGLCGIPAVRGGFIRPLIYASREDVIGYLRDKNQDYVTDSTNLSDDYTRNRIRHRIVPLLREINPSLEKTMLGTRRALEAEEAFAEESAARAYEECILPKRDGFSRSLTEYPQAQRIRCISRLLRDNAISVSFERLSAADALLSGGGYLMLSTDIRLFSDKDGLRLLRFAADSEPFCVPLRYGELTLCGARTLCAVLEITSSEDILEILNKKSTYNVLDYDKIKGQVFVRSRREGDRIRLYGREHSSSVKKLLNTAVPASERAELCFLEDDDGLIYIERLGVADRVRVDASTRQILRISHDCEAEL